jgi:hypothetical protein
MGKRIVGTATLDYHWDDHNVGPADDDVAEFHSVEIMLAAARVCSIFTDGDVAHLFCVRHSSTISARPIKAVAKHHGFIYGVKELVLAKA